jgi:polyhydroxyalkanoate synthesis regulator phasin
MAQPADCRSRRSGVVTARIRLQHAIAMNDALKKILLAGVGAAVLTKEKIDDSLAGYVKQGRLSAADARQVAQRLARDGRREFLAAAADAGGKIKQVVARADRQTQARMDQLLDRIAQLEGRKKTKPARGKTRR